MRRSHKKPFLRFPSQRLAQKQHVRLEIVSRFTLVRERENFWVLEMKTQLLLVTEGIDLDCGQLPFSWCEMVEGVQ